MNPFRWLLNLSEAAAERRGGKPDPWAFSFDSSVDAREYEEHITVHGATLFIANRKLRELWSELSPLEKRFARITDAMGGGLRLSVYERIDGKWIEFEGASIFDSIDDAQATARKLMLSH